MILLPGHVTSLTLTFHTLLPPRCTLSDEQGCDKGGYMIHPEHTEKHVGVCVCVCVRACASGESTFGISTASSLIPLPPAVLLCSRPE